MAIKNIFGKIKNNDNDYNELKIDYKKFSHHTGHKKDFLLAKRILTYFRPHIGLIILGVIASIFVGLSTAGTAWLIKPALDDIFIKKDERMLVLIPIAFLALIILKGAGRYFQGLTMGYVGIRVIEVLRQQIFTRIVTLPLSFYESIQLGNHMSRITGDVGIMLQSLPACVGIIRQIVTMFALLGVVVYQDLELALYALVILPLAGAPFLYFSRKVRTFGRVNAELGAHITSILHELLSGIRVIKAFATEKKEIDRYTAENVRIMMLGFRQGLLTGLSSPIMELVGAMGIGTVILFGGYKVINGSMTPGEFFSFVAALIMLYDPLKGVTAANAALQGAFVGAERVFTILDDPIHQAESGGEKQFNGVFERLEFRHVSLAYGTSAFLKDEPSPVLALEDISLTIDAGMRVALVGPSGAGKTSLANLIVRFYESYSGEILLNNTPLQEYDLASLRRSVAMVSQEGFLFNLSLRDNIAYGQDEYTDEAVRAAAVAAYADDFIEALPEGYETFTGERGIKLSGGQKQRVTIARALMKNAPLLILDEATSALDSESELMVQQALENLKHGRTSIIIAHRLSTILDADMIVVMDAGRIIAQGTHMELLQSCELYTRLYTLQFDTENDKEL